MNSSFDRDHKGIQWLHWSWIEFVRQRTVDVQKWTSKLKAAVEGRERKGKYMSETHYSEIHS